jgi:tetratricopeptide (TPR) repeat protein
VSKRKTNRRQPPRPPSALSVRRSTDGRSWVLVHPRCVRDRAEDLEDVQSMIKAGEPEIAADELRWLLSGCPEFIAAHELLGELAVALQGDLALARGHFGAGYQLGLQTLRRAKMPQPLLYAQPANRPFFEAGRGLIWTLEKLGRREMASEILQTLLELDPSDPLRLKALVDDLRTGGAPVIGLTQGLRQRES